MNTIFQKKLLPVIHITVWLIFILLPFFFINQDEKLFTPRFLERVSRIIFFAIIFYINYLILTPKLFFTKKNLWYFLSLVILILITTIFWIWFSELIFTRIYKPFDNEDFSAKFHHESIHRNFMLANHIFTSVLVCGLASMIKISEKLFSDSKKQKEIEKDLLTSKIAFLKHQISPHFFLNTLNNIYSLTEINVEDSRKAIHKLSKMMRYMLYDSENNETDLFQEIDFIKSYIELMRLRYSEDVEIIFETQNIKSNIKIPPLLFISFIENAFKHGVSYESKSFIKIYLESTDDYIVFRCMNSIHIQKNNELDKNSGIGMDNVKARLNLLFKSDYTLNISENNNIYSVELKIKISKL